MPTVLRTAVAALREGRDPAPRPPGRVLRVLVVLTAVVLAGTTFGAAGSVVDLGRTGTGVVPLLAAAAGVPLLVALRHPTAGWAASAVAALVVATLPVHAVDPWRWPVPHGLALLALLAAVAGRESTARTVVAWSGTAALFALGSRADLAPGWVVATAAVAVVGVLAGRLGSARRELARAAAATEQETARRVVLEERARIARELHDVVAHHMSLVAVRAETAPYRIEGLSEAARAELAAVGDAARAALGETRALLTVLRDDGQDRTPQPDLGGLDALVAAARAAGVDVTADVRGRLDDLRPGTSLAAYRIVAEALANAARHAPGVPVRLAVHRAREGLGLEVVNAAPAPAGPAGHGITGMRERARAEGGELTVTRDGGSCTVRAHLPVPERG